MEQEACGKCGASRQPRDTFCRVCGTPWSLKAAAPPAPATMASAPEPTGGNGDASAAPGRSKRRERSDPQKAALGCGIMVAAIAIGVAVVAIVVAANKSGSPAGSASANPQRAGASPAVAWSSAPVTAETVRAALSHADSLQRSVGLEKSTLLAVIPPDADAGKGCPCVELAYKSTGGANETDYLTIGTQTAFSAMRVLFKNPTVGEVTVTLLTDWVDQYGQKNQAPAVFATMTRATASRVNWSGLASRVETDNKSLLCIADEYSIHLAIYSRLKDKGCLVGQSKSRALP